MSELLDAIEIESAPAPPRAVIWLHGLGADGHDFEPVVAELALPASPAIRFIFPHAPMRPVTINDGQVMRAWYDVKDDAGTRREDADGVRRSERQIVALIERERARGIAPAGLVLAGFSQGGAMALHTGLRYAERLAGILALSCFLPLPDTLGAEASQANRDLPVFWAHGQDDQVIPPARARRSRDLLLELGYRVEWREYAIGHFVSPQEIADIAAWLGQAMKAVRAPGSGSRQNIQ